MEIKREKYFSQLLKYEKNGRVKIITGIRRCGKSYLIFNLFYRYLLSNDVDSNHIISIALDEIANAELRNPLKLNRYIQDRIVDDKQYYVPVSSPKVKHYQMANSLDFLRIEDKTKASLYAVLNLNNMIPVPKECISKLRYNEIQKYRAFKSEKERSDYIYLLQNEKLIIDRMADTIKKKAERLYKSVIEKPYSRLAQRCCNFKSLEEALDKYMECGDS